MNDDERAFVVACRLAARDDELPRKIYADWLDEQGRQSEADAAREGLPRLDCSCKGSGYSFAEWYILFCPRCHGLGEVNRWEVRASATVPFRGIVPGMRVDARVVTEPCKACGGKGVGRVCSVCEECNGRWTPPLIPLSPGDPLYVDAHGRCVPYGLAFGQKPVATFVRQGASVRSRLLVQVGPPDLRLTMEDGRPRRFDEDD